MIPAEQIRGTFESNHALAERLSADITEMEALAKPGFGANSMNWILGHIVNARAEALAQLDTAFTWEVDESGLYRTGASPLIPGSERPLLYLLKRLQEAQALLDGALQAAPDEYLRGVVETRFGDRPRWEHLAGLAWHETYHVGQLELLRQFAVDMRRAAAEPGETVRVGHIELFVTDVANSLTFYRDVIGFTAAADQSPGLAWLEKSGLEILLRSGGQAAQIMHYQDAPAGIVLYTEDLQAAARQLISLGLTFRGTVDTEKCLTFTDPDGHWFQLVNPDDF